MWCGNCMLHRIMIVCSGVFVFFYFFSDVLERSRVRNAVQIARSGVNSSLRWRTVEAHARPSSLLNRTQNKEFGVDSSVLTGLKSPRIQEISVAEIPCKPSPEPDIDARWPCWIGAVANALQVVPVVSFARNSTWLIFGTNHPPAVSISCGIGPVYIVAPPHLVRNATMICRSSFEFECSVVQLDWTSSNNTGAPPFVALAHLVAMRADAGVLVILGGSDVLCCEDAYHRLHVMRNEPRVWVQETGTHLAITKGTWKALGIQMTVLWHDAWAHESVRNFLRFFPAEFRLGSLGNLSSVATDESVDTFAVPHTRCGIDTKCVFSYSLYGDDPKYTEGAIENARLAPLIFPGWTMRFVHDNTVPSRILVQLNSLGCELIDVKLMKLQEELLPAKMTWRFLIADDTDVDFYSVRDSDSRISFRERETVREFVDSSLTYHVLRDHVAHNYPMNGGMWGGRRNSDLNMTELLGGSGVGSSYSADMGFLAKFVWPLIVERQMGHDSMHCNAWPHARHFPTRRSERNEHVGGVFDKDNGMRMSDVTPYGFASPPACEADKDLADVLFRV